MAAVTEAASHTPLAETDETQVPSRSCRSSRKRAHRNTAAFMLPVVVIVSMIGGRMDAERVINWFHLDGRKENANKRSFGATINTL